MELLIINEAEGQYGRGIAIIELTIGKKNSAIETYQ
jgi:hypothetical protein